MQCWGRTTEIYNTAVACLLRTHSTDQCAGVTQPMLFLECVDISDFPQTSTSMPSPFDLLHSLCTIYIEYILKMCKKYLDAYMWDKIIIRKLRTSFLSICLSSRTFENCVGWGSFFIVQNCPMPHLLISSSKSPQTRNTVIKKCPWKFPKYSPGSEIWSPFRNALASPPSIWNIVDKWFLVVGQ